MNEDDARNPGPWQGAAVERGEIGPQNDLSRAVETLWQAIPRDEQLRLFAEGFRLDPILLALRPVERKEVNPPDRSSGAVWSDAEDRRLHEALKTLTLSFTGRSLAAIVTRIALISPRWSHEKPAERPTFADAIDPSAPWNRRRPSKRSLS